MTAAIASTQAPMKTQSSTNDTIPHTCSIAPVL